MKKLLFFLIFAATVFTVNAQSATVTLDASGSGVTGGRGTGKITSAKWVLETGAPAPVIYVDATGKAGTDAALKTYAVISKAGTYNFDLTVTDDLGNSVKGTMQVIAYGEQRIIIKFAQPLIEVDLK